MNLETEQSINTITNIAARVAEALESAAIEHGEAAVDLALLAYQLEAARTLLVATALVIPALFIYRVFRIVNRKVGHCDDDYFIQIMVVGTYAVVSLPMFAHGLAALFQPVTWVAAFGSPELMIATKALQAAGLL